MTDRNGTERIVGQQVDVLRHAATLLVNEPEAALVYSEAADDLDCGEGVSNLHNLLAAALMTIKALS